MNYLCLICHYKDNQVKNCYFNTYCGNCDIGIPVTDFCNEFNYEVLYGEKISKEKYSFNEYLSITFIPMNESNSLHYISINDDNTYEVFIRSLDE